MTDSTSAPMPDDAALSGDPVLPGDPETSDYPATPQRSPRFGRSMIKMLIRLALFPIVAAMGIFIVSFLFRTMADVTRSEETAAIFNVSAELHHDLVSAVEWRPDPEGLPKQLPPLEREAITDTWLRAWAQFLILSDGSGPVGSSVDGEATDGIAEYFAGAAASAMLDGHPDWLGLPIHQIGHELQLNFYSDDGSVISMSAVASNFLRGQPVNGEIEWYDTTESYDVVFVLEDGNWRITSWVRRSSEGAWATEVDFDVRPLAIDNVRALTWEPSGQTVENFWTDPDLRRATTEIAAIDDLGFNTIRFELPYEILGGRDIEPENLAPAAALLDIAEVNGLHVVVSVLGGRTEHQPLHWDADDDHLRTVMGTLGDHPALLLWEIGSEPDTHLGVERTDQRMLDAWLAHIGRTVREADPDTPISIGWSSPRAAIESPPIADAIAFTWLGDPLAVEADLDVLRTVAGERPIMISNAVFHTGADSIVLPLPLPLPPIPAPGSQTEIDQARWYADMLIAVEDLGLDGFTVGTLRDVDVDAVAVFEQAEAERLHDEEKEAIAEQNRLFPPPATPEPKEAGPAHVEAPVIAEVTWPTGSAAATGLVRVNGSPKPAAAVFAPDADLEAVPYPTLLATLSKPFNMFAIALLVAVIGGWALLWLWSRNIIRLPRIRGRLTGRRTGSIPAPTGTPAPASTGMAGRVRSRLPQIPRRPADGGHAQQRLRRNRKKVGVNSPIDQSQVGAPDLTAAPRSGGRFRRVIAWLNAPVLPEDSIAESPPDPVAAAAPISEASPASEAVEAPTATAGVEAPVVEHATATAQLPEQAAAEPVAAATAQAAAAAQAATAAAQQAAAAQQVAEEAAEQAAQEIAAQAAAEQAAAQQAAEEAAAKKASIEKAAVQRAAEKAAIEKAAIEKAAIEKAAIEKAAIEKAAIEKAAIEKAAADDATIAKAAEEAAAQAVERLAAEEALEQLAADRAAVERAARKKAEAQAATDALEVERAAAQRAVEQLAAEREVAEREAAEREAAEHTATKEAAIARRTAEKVDVARAESQPTSPANATPAPSQPVAWPMPPDASNRSENGSASGPPAPFAPPESLADALPAWPTGDMLYGDVHDAMYGIHDKGAPAETSMAVVEVNLQAIDLALGQVAPGAKDQGPHKYVPFLARALCVVDNLEDGPTHIEIHSPDREARRISNVNDKRLTAILSELFDEGVNPTTASPSVIIHVSAASGKHLSVEIGDGNAPTVSLVHLHNRPVTVRDRLGGAAIANHSMGLLSVAAASTSSRADEYLDRLREILETRDWITELT